MKVGQVALPPFEPTCWRLELTGCSLLAGIPRAITASLGPSMATPGTSAAHGLLALSHKPEKKKKEKKEKKKKKEKEREEKKKRSESQTSYEG